MTNWKLPEGVSEEETIDVVEKILKDIVLDDNTTEGDLDKYQYDLDASQEALDNLSKKENK